MERPVIGITPGYDDGKYISVFPGFQNILMKLGCIPVILPLTSDPQHLENCIDTVDGIVFTGGGDIDPVYFGEYQLPGCGAISPERDSMQLPLAKLLYERNIPTIGICRGMQVMHVALQGKVIQDIHRSNPEAILHRQQQPSMHPSHPVTITKETRLHGIIEKDEIWVNSLHHQACRMNDDAIMQAAAYAPDGMVEAVEAADHPFFIGVQWHPWRMPDDENSIKLFKAFADSCIQN